MDGLFFRPMHPHCLASMSLYQVPESPVIFPKQTSRLQGISFGRVNKPGLSVGRLAPARGRPRPIARCPRVRPICGGRTWAYERAVRTPRSCTRAAALLGYPSHGLIGVGQDGGTAPVSQLRAPGSVPRSRCPALGAQRRARHRACEHALGSFPLPSSLPKPSLLRGGRARQEWKYYVIAHRRTKNVEASAPPARRRRSAKAGLAGWRNRACVGPKYHGPEGPARGIGPVFRRATWFRHATNGRLRQRGRLGRELRAGVFQHAPAPDAGPVCVDAALIVFLSSQSCVCGGASRRARDHPRTALSARARPAPRGRRAPKSPTSASNPWPSPPGPAVPRFPYRRFVPWSASKSGRGSDFCTGNGGWG